MNGTTDRRPVEAAMTRLTGRALRLTVFIGEHDRWHHKPLYAEIVHRAHAAGLAGASVFRGIEGFGASSLIHTARLLSLSEDLPVAVIVVDTEERVRAFLPQLDELVREGLVMLDDCEVIRYVGRGGASRTRDGKGENSL
jgi:PII-like signaling protein